MSPDPLTIERRRRRKTCSFLSTLFFFFPCLSYLLFFLSLSLFSFSFWMILERSGEKKAGEKRREVDELFLVAKMLQWETSCDDLKSHSICCFHNNISSSPSFSSFSPFFPLSLSSFKSEKSVAFSGTELSRLRTFVELLDRYLPFTSREEKKKRRGREEEEEEIYYCTRILCVRPWKKRFVSSLSLSLSSHLFTLSIYGISFHSLFLSFLLSFSPRQQLLLGRVIHLIQFSPQF